MTVLVSLSTDLAVAGERLAQRAVVRRHRGKLAVFLSGGVLALGGIAVATEGLWRPQLGDERRGRPTAIPAAPAPAGQRGFLGVLRREQTAADRGAAAEYAARLLGQGFGGVRTATFRVLAGDAVLFSARQTPAGRNRLCLFLPDPVDGGGLGCWSKEEILAGNATIGLFMGPPGSTEGTVLGLVPDGVAAVRVADSAGTLPVHDNAYTGPVSETGAQRPITMLDEAGKPVR